ncbi:hypothetical protein, partial [Holospora obtusa]|uniref:hypothetical protein n=1 Tax=Holospora obtusa TaxID=49893 RepID=UPI00058B1D8A
MKLKILSLLMIFCNQGFSVNFSLPIILENIEKNNMQGLLDNIQNLLLSTNKQASHTTVKKMIHRKIFQNTKIPTLWYPKYIDRTVEIFFCKNNDQDLSIKILQEIFKDFVCDFSKSYFLRPTFLSFIETILKKKEKQIVADVSGEKNQQTSFNLNSFSSEIAKKFLDFLNLEKFSKKEPDFFCRLIRKIISSDNDPELSLYALELLDCEKTFKQMDDRFFVSIIEAIRGDNVNPVIVNLVWSFFNLEQRFTRVTSLQFQGMLFDILYSNEHHLDEVLLTSMNLKEHLDGSNSFCFAGFLNIILASPKKLPLVVETTLRSLNFKQMCAQLPLIEFYEMITRGILRSKEKNFEITQYVLDDLSESLRKQMKELRINDRAFFVNGLYKSSHSFSENILKLLEPSFFLIHNDENDNLAQNVYTSIMNDIFLKLEKKDISKEERNVLVKKGDIL